VVEPVPVQHHPFAEPDEARDAKVAAVAQHDRFLAKDNLALEGITLRAGLRAGCAWLRFPVIAGCAQHQQA